MVPRMAMGGVQLMRGSSSTRQEVRLLSLLILLLICLIGLSLGLDSLRLQKGLRLARTERPEPEASETVPSNAEEDPSTPWATLGLASAALVVGGIGLIVSRRMRRTLLMYLYGGLIFVGTFVLVAMALSHFSFDLSQGSVGGPVVDALPEVPPADPSRGLVQATAIALSGLAVGTAIFLGWRFRRRERAPASAKPAVLEGLIESAAEAAQSIRQGHDARGAVTDCYRRMLRLLEDRGTASTPYLTPREFAVALRGQGMPIESVDRLTGLFELVRYGQRNDASLSQQAAECLEAVSRSSLVDPPPAEPGGSS